MHAWQGRGVSPLWLRNGPETGYPHKPPPCPPAIVRHKAVGYNSGKLPQRLLEKGFNEGLGSAEKRPAVNSRVVFSLAAKSRAIAIPVDLDSQVNNLFLKSHNIVQKTAMNWRLSARNAARRDSVLAASRDYRNIIERLQVMPGAERGEPHLA